VRGTAVELSHEEYRTVWHALGLGARHWNLELPGLPELTEQQHSAQVGSVLAGLRARGLADQRGFAPALADSLRLLASPAREINGWVQAGARPGGQGRSTPVRLLAGASGEWAVLAMLDERRLVVRTGPAGELCHAVARQLPERPAGPGSSVSVPSALLAAPAPDGRAGLTGAQLETRLVGGGVSPVDARSFAAMMRGPKLGGGKFGAAVRDRHARRYSAGAALVYLATERGGYTLQPLRGPDGSAWTTLAPATLAQVAQRLCQFLDTIRLG
jgi:hypothetical protein